MTRSTGIFEDVEGGSLVRLTISPGSAKTEVERADEWRGAVRVRISARPVGGEANSELIGFLAKTLSVPPNEIRIVRGSKGRRKTVFVPLGAADVKHRLGFE
jgi:uncharacterized protein (TIGR00251 family)